MTLSTSIGYYWSFFFPKKPLHCEVVKKSTKDLFPGCTVLALSVGPTEEKYLLKAFAILLLASVRVS